MARCLLSGESLLWVRKWSKKLESKKHRWQLQQQGHLPRMNWTCWSRPFLLLHLFHLGAQPMGWCYQYWACLSHLFFCLPMLRRSALRGRQKVGFTNALGISQFARVDSQMRPHWESGGFRYPVFLHSSSYSLLCQSSSSLLKPLVIVAIWFLGHRTGWFRVFWRDPEWYLQFLPYILPKQDSFSLSRHLTVSLNTSKSYHQAGRWTMLLF